MLHPRDADHGLGALFMERDSEQSVGNERWIISDLLQRLDY